MTHAAGDTVCDILVVGSGAGGLSAAFTAAHHGLDVIIAEKASQFGGTTAWSGGWLWIPRNPLAIAAGIDEDPEEVSRYLRSELGNRANDPRLDVFLENGPRMVSFFAEESEVEWIDGNRIPDFHETPGRALGGRSVSVAPYDGRNLGTWVKKLRPPLDVISLAGMGIAGGQDMAHFFNATRRPASALYAARRLMRHIADLKRHGRGMHLVNGNALVARLIRSVIDKGVRLWSEAPVVSLLCKDGRVTGAVIQTATGEKTVLARCGVVLAAGGFPHDYKRHAEHFDHAPKGIGHHSAAPPENTGDGLTLAAGVNAALDFDLENPAAWAPVSLVPDGKGGYKRFPHLIERAKPGIIAVEATGRRFVNEADSYHDFTSALLRTADAGETPRSWLIADHRAQRRFGLGFSKPFPFPLSPYLRSGYLKRGRTLDDLATECGLPAAQLKATIERFNAQARMGDDPDFDRGKSAYNRVQGAADHGPNPSLAPLEKGPFYAVELVPGSLGTFAGIKTSPTGEVLDSSGNPIAGLYACGNDAASIMGGNYPSGGITIGPAMTFGYVIGRAIAGLPVAGQDTHIQQTGQSR